MNRFTIIIFSLVLTILSCSQPQKKAVKKKPNVVFIFADDLTYSAIHALGNKEVQTPNLDRLVAKGTTFTHAYNMGGWNGAICTASRSMIISGRSVWNANQFRERWQSNEDFDKTWGKLMESQGYSTYMTGKWHIDAGAEKVFKNVTHIRPGMPGDAWNHDEMVQKFKDIKGTDIAPSSLMPVGYNRPKDKNDTIWSPTNTKFGGFWEGGKHWSEVLKDDALSFIDQAKNQDTPFFMYLAFNAPHDPRQAPQEYIDKYPLESISLPKSWLPEYPHKDGMGNGPDLRDEALAPFPRTEYATKKHIQEYYALITHMDEQIGHILKGLEASGKMGNTYIIFTADHGLAMGRHGLIGKQSLFDHSIRAPFMIVGPEIPKGKKVSEDIYLQDAMATSLELAGIEKPGYVEFNSLLTLAKGEVNKGSYESIYGAYIDLQRMIRKDGYKLIVYPKLSKVLLFDIKNDPEEMVDISSQPAFKEKVLSLFTELLTLQKEKNDPLDLAPLYQQYSKSLSQL
ncbi:sulfatase-like hydrolase/transferase [Aquimarina sp. RZ0]|uniref:sulfatase-like hydrolase/transferase n=1 Tax=Aquimarina sp. RZ0 TaxID=2607730 RepID=UPI0011F108A4|nr:sulfatase-like hydrolase/transferase [Aquimarina sp. RZ0]KAA1243514.1 sulfatase-like hydrolase/transferase [Aquimarina sp. RZ0]